MAIDPDFEVNDLGSLLGGFPAIDDTVKTDAMQQLMNYFKNAQKNPLTEEQIAELMRIQSPSGAKFTVDDSAAPQFQGFLNDLEGTGYKIDPNQSGGYADRNIAGTNTRSKHSTGQAIDINWTNNPEGGKHDLPSNTGELAAKHGLIWGNNWTNRKRGPDAMHFEVGGTPQTNYPNGVTPVANGPAEYDGGTYQRTTVPPPGQQPPVQQVSAQSSAPATFQVPKPQRASDVQNSQETGGTWSNWLSEPGNRSLLIGMGLQLMVPQWGNPMSQLGQALGNGVASAAGHLQTIRDQETQDLKLGDQELDRRSREKIAEGNQANRVEVAGLRSAAALEKLKMSKGPTTAKEMDIFNKAKRDALIQLQKENNDMLSPNYQKHGTPEDMEMKAEEAATRALQSNRATFGSADESVPAPKASDTTSGKKASPSESGGSVPTVPGQNSPAGKSTIPTPNVSFEEAIKNPKIQAAIKNPEGRKYLETYYPQFRSKIADYLGEKPKKGQSADFYSSGDGE